MKLPWCALQRQLLCILADLCASTVCALTCLSGVRRTRNLTGRQKGILGLGRKVFAFSDRCGVSLACRCRTLAPRPQLLGDRNRGQEVVRATLVCTLQARSYVAQVLTRWHRLARPYLKTTSSLRFDEAASFPLRWTLRKRKGLLLEKDVLNQGKCSITTHAAIKKQLRTHINRFPGAQTIKVILTALRSEKEQTILKD